MVEKRKVLFSLLLLLLHLTCTICYSIHKEEMDHYQGLAPSVYSRRLDLARDWIDLNRFNGQPYIDQVRVALFNF